MEDVRFYSLDSFFFLRILCDIFNITFHICYLKSKLWGGFPSKISFWMSHTPHENSPFPVTQNTLSASYMHTYKHVHSFLRPDSYQETNLSVFYWCYIIRPPNLDLALTSFIVRNCFDCFTWLKSCRFGRKTWSLLSDWLWG